MPAALETGFFGGNVAAWHGLGTVIPEDVIDSERALELGGLDWEVERFPVFAEMPGDENSPAYIPANKWANVRMSDNTVLGVVGDRYNILQNRDAFAFGDMMVDSDEAKWHTAGSLKNGSVVWMLMKRPEDIFIGGLEDERIEQYILIANSHDGSTSVNAAITPVRVVCQNTLSLALTGAARKFSVRHTNAMNGRLTEARRILGITASYYESLEAIGNELVSSAFSNAEFEAFLNSIIPIPTEENATPTRAETRQETLKNIYVNADNLNNIRGTRWGALQAVIEFDDHNAVVRQQKNNPADVRMERIVKGGGIRQQALDYLLAV